MMSVLPSDTGADIVESVSADLRILRNRIVCHSTGEGHQYLMRDIRNVKRIDEALRALEKVRWTA